MCAQTASICAIIIRMVKKQAPLVRLKKNKTSIRFDELVALLRECGYSVQSVTGSHHIFGKPDQLSIMLVKPHGGKKNCHPMDVNEVIRVLETRKDA